ncbi:MAG: zf-HC2 domain-containing protein [Capsulimonadales bacterium]|nr:zf-HC2 domain-containing protein [Capsulimonadales bacterium]
MKDCNSIRPLLSEYVDGMLDENRTWEIKKHLVTCSVCARVADDFSKTARLLASLPPEQPSANFEEMLARRLADEVLRPKPASPFAYWKERWTEFAESWHRPGVRPAFASGAVLAMMGLFAFFAVRPDAPANRITVRATPSVGAAHEPDPVNELWQEHNAYASSVSLGDRGSVLEVINEIDGTNL